MTDSNPKLTPVPSAAPSPKKKSPIFARTIVSGTVVLATLGAIAIAIPWLAYRCRNVVVSEAVVKGTVTSIGTRIEGRIKSIEVEVGQHVLKDQVVLRLDDAHFVAEAERARAALKGALSDLESEKLAITQSRTNLNLAIKKAEALRQQAAGAVQAEKSNLQKLEEMYTALNSLLTNGGAARVAVAQAAADCDHSRAIIQGANGTLDAADTSLEKAKSDLEGIKVRESRLGVLNSQIEVARAQLAAAESDLEATVIRAPEDGRVLERSVEVGGSAKVGQPMLSMWIGRAWIQAWTDERDLRKFRIGSPVEVVLDRDPSHKLAGRVEALGLESDKQLQPAPVPATLHSFIRLNALVPVRISLDEDNARIQLGLSAMVGIKRGTSGPDVKSEIPRVVKTTNAPPHQSTVVSDQQRPRLAQYPSVEKPALLFPK